MTKKTCKIDWIMGSVLFFIPFLHVCLGINITDQGYNLANFELFPEMNQTWMISTLAATIVGKIFTWMPFGHCMLGMNVYCTLLLSILTAAFFCLLKKDFSRYAVFAGLMMAICFSWAPKVTLYQYLSYYLFDIAAIILLWGIRREDRHLMFKAGMVLGLNLFVRFPNILQTALIVVVIFAALLRKKRFQELFKDVLICVAGYLTVVVPVLIAIECIWGRGSYLAMISSLFAMTEEATSYSPLSMFTSVYYAYIESFYWFKWFLIEVLGAILIYGFLKNKWTKHIVQLLIAGGFAAILIFCWYKGVLNTNYADYGSVYTWGANLLILSGGIMVCTVILPGVAFEWKLYALTVLVIQGITPLGSNNVLYSNYNNLYLLAPVLLGILERLWRWERVRSKCGKTISGGRNSEREKMLGKWSFSAMPVVLIGGMIAAVTLCQAFFFHNAFVFGDKVSLSEAVCVEGNSKLEGMYTTEENAQALRELTLFIDESNLSGSAAVVWSEAPILYYILDIDCAIGHFWPALTSYPYEEFISDINAMKENPLIIYETRKYGDLMGGDYTGDQKTKKIAEILRDGEYDEVFRNCHYAVCVSRKNK